MAAFLLEYMIAFLKIWPVLYRTDFPGQMSEFVSKENSQMGESVSKEYSCCVFQRGSFSLLFILARYCDMICAGDE